MPTPTPDRAARARELLAVRARRASNLRRRVVAGALATFALAWGVIAFHGPMGEATATTASTAATATTSTSSSAGTATADSSTTSGSASDDSSSGDAVVTAQS